MFMLKLENKTIAVLFFVSVNVFYSWIWPLQNLYSINWLIAGFKAPLNKLIISLLRPRRAEGACPFASVRGGAQVGVSQLLRAARALSLSSRARASSPSRASRVSTRWVTPQHPSGRTDGSAARQWVCVCERWMLLLLLLQRMQMQWCIILHER